MGAPRPPVFLLAEHGTLAYEACVALRREVLRTPLGLDFSDEELDAEGGDLHAFLALEDEDGATDVVAVAVGVLLPGGEAKIRQVAVAPEHGGRGFGTLVMRELERELARRGARAVRLHARETVVGFYSRLGYTPEGPIFEEIGLDHRLMTKPFVPET